jgi:flagellar basal-body rod modification protein FlgD
MPSIGRPASPDSNQFGNITMSQTTAGRQRSVGDQLNRLAGRAPESRFVDGAKHNQMDKDAFLKLLAHQLQNQDPLEPMDQKKFAADLAQFSQLEQLANLNTKMDGLGSNTPNEAKFHGASFLGTEVLTQGTTVDYSGNGDWVNIPFNLPENAAQVKLRLFDSSNQLVAEINRENLTRGNHMITWDGEMNDGTPAVKDNYRMEVLALSSTGENFRAETQTSGRVEGVAFENGETVLNLEGGRRVFLRDVTSFKLPQEREQKMPALHKAGIDAYNQSKSQEL